MVWLAGCWGMGLGGEKEKEEVRCVLSTLESLTCELDGDGVYDGKREKR